MSICSCLLLLSSCRVLEVSRLRLALITTYPGRMALSQVQQMATVDASPSLPYLYTLSLDCPIPWPAKPSYPIRQRPGGARAGRVTMAVDASDTTRGRAAMVKTSLEQSDSSNSSSSSVVGHPAGLLGAPSIEQELLHGDELVGKGEGGGDQREEEEEMTIDMDMASEAPWPGTLHALYLECLYAVRPALSRSGSIPYRGRGLT